MRLFGRDNYAGLGMVRIIEISSHLVVFELRTVGERIFANIRKAFLALVSKCIVMEFLLDSQEQ